MKSQIKVHTFGCKVNTYDSGLLQSRLASFRSDDGEFSSLKADPSSKSGSGLKASFVKRKVHVLNTCAVTAEATKEALRKVRRLKKEDPDSVVVVTGCAAQVDTEIFSDAAESNVSGPDLIVANSHKTEIGTIVDDFLSGRSEQRLFKSNIFKKKDLEPGGGKELGHTRSFLKIQDGCNSFCSYCVIPFGRGKSRSLSIDSLVERINELHESGTQEVVLTGVHIGDYCDDDLILRRLLQDPESYPGSLKQTFRKAGTDVPSLRILQESEVGFEALIENILMRTKIPRIRLSSLEPVEISDRLLDCFTDSRLCPHFHMSIQSACTEVLNGMKRKYSALEVEKSLTEIALKVPSAFVGMDLIVGFNGESDSQFEETRSRLADLPWTKIHVFPYSERPGTTALELCGLVYPHVRAERAKMMRELSLERFVSEARRQIGSVKKVLVLKDEKKGVSRGLSRDYWPVVFPELIEPRSVNTEIEVQISDYESMSPKVEGHLLGTEE